MTHFLTRAAILAASAAVLAACASTPRYPTEEGASPGTGPQAPEMPSPQYPTRLPPNGQVQADPYDDPAPSAAPSAGVESSALPPPPANGPVETTELAPLPEPEYRPAPPPPPRPPRTETREVVSVSGKVVDASGKPKTYTVKSGQGLDAIARELGTTRKQLAEDNDLKEPYRIKPGQVLKGPASKAKAYVVGSGDTLYAIARRFGVSASAIAEENDMALDDPIRPGQRLTLPAGFKDSGPVRRTVTVTLDPEPEPIRQAEAPRQSPQAQPQRPSAGAPRPVPPPPVATPPVTTPPVVATRPPATTPPVTRPPASTPPVVATRPEPTRPPVTRPPAAQPPAAQPPATTPAPGPVRPPATPPLQDDRPPNFTDADYARMGQGRFAWPVRGTVLSGFGPKAGGQRNDGLDIGASAGTPVRAAADGTVVYSGGDVPGFGVTVLIQHADGWVTVYGHLQRADVKMQQRVTQGQQIGLVGQSGTAPRPQLHFEVRHSPSPRFKAKAIDPSLVLPR
jgi:murein DD-endopeptidase MepM/ murein hydrolase activator NlpD